MSAALGARRFRWPDVLLATGCAALLSGIPSTLHAWWTGGDVLEATRAAGAMLVPATSGDVELIAAAALVHGCVSLFWGLTLAVTLPRARLVAWALSAAAGIAVLDLLIIARLFFPEVYALPFWPQFADHLAFGGIFGAVLVWRRRAPGARQDIP